METAEDCTWSWLSLLCLKAFGLYYSSEFCYGLGTMCCILQFWFSCRIFFFSLNHEVNNIQDSQLTYRDHERWATVLFVLVFFKESYQTLLSVDTSYKTRVKMHCAGIRLFQSQFWNLFLPEKYPEVPSCIICHFDSKGNFMLKKINQFC